MNGISSGTSSGMMTAGRKRGRTEMMQKQQDQRSSVATTQSGMKGNTSLPSRGGGRSSSSTNNAHVQMKVVSIFGIFFHCLSL